jgi:hypothetical protein
MHLTSNPRKAQTIELTTRKRKKNEKEKIKRTRTINNTTGKEWKHQEQTKPEYCKKHTKKTPPPSSNRSIFSCSR